MSRPTDDWDDAPRRPTTSTASGFGSTSGARTKAAPITVRDDWEMDDDDEDVDSGRSLEDKNKQIWEDANAKEQYPMPALVISRGASASFTTPTLPLNQPPPMRILKRPSASPSPSSPNSNTPTGETLQEREARYQAARERIFGQSPSETGASEGTENKKSPLSRKGSSQSTPQMPISPNSNAAPNLITKVVRNPRGPSNVSSGGVVSANGFAERQRTSPPKSSSSPTISSASTTPSDSAS